MTRMMETFCNTLEIGLYLDNTFPGNFLGTVPHPPFGTISWKWYPVDVLPLEPLPHRPNFRLPSTQLHSKYLSAVVEWQHPLKKSRTKNHLQIKLCNSNKM